MKAFGKVLGLFFLGLLLLVVALGFALTTCSIPMTTRTKSARSPATRPTWSWT